MHESAYNYVRDFYLARLADKRRSAIILEFGSRDVNGSVRGIFKDYVYWGIDLTRGVGVDQVADAVRYVYPNGGVDVVLCLETLEHTPHVRAIIHNAYRNLVPGGYFVVTCATYPRLPHSAVDGGILRRGEYYANIDPQDLKTWTVKAGFEVYALQTKRIPHHGGDLYMTARKPSHHSDA